MGAFLAGALVFLLVTFWDLDLDLDLAGLLDPEEDRDREEDREEDLEAFRALERPRLTGAMLFLF